MKAFLKNTLLLISVTMMSVAAWAQEKKVDIDIDVHDKKDSTQFFQQPWVWIVGGAIFILILIALLRPRQRSN